MSFASPWPSFSWSVLVFGSIARLMTGLGKLHRLENDRVLRVADGVTGPYCFETDRCGNITSVDLLYLLTLVGVHLEKSPDSLSTVTPWVKHQRSRLHNAGVDPDEGQAPNVADSVITLNTSAANGSLSSAARSTSVSSFFRGSRPEIGGTSSGDGK